MSGSQSFSQSYNYALNKFSNDEYQASIQILTEQLASREEFDEESLLFYRLWVENLTALKDQKSLIQLSKHIKKLRSIDQSLSNDQRTELCAIDGLILFHLGYEDGVQLYQHSLEGFRHLPHVEAFYNETTDLDAMEIKQWLVKLEPTEALNMMKQNPDQIKEIQRPLPSQAKPGDLCFFAFESHFSNFLEANTEDYPRKTWNLVAIYECTDRPQLDPINGFVANLSLLEILNDRISFDVEFTDELPADKPQRSKLPSGVYEMDHTAISHMTESVRRRRLGVDHVAERRHQKLKIHTPAN